MKAVRIGKWKGILKNIKKGNTRIELYDLEKDIREEHNIADEYPGIVKKIETIMKEAHTEPENKLFKL